MKSRGEEVPRVFSRILVRILGRPGGRKIAEKKLTPGTTPKKKFFFPQRLKISFLESGYCFSSWSSKKKIIFFSVTFFVQNDHFSKIREKVADFQLFAI